MNKQKLIKLRCKAWGITEAEYYCNRCSDFSLEDMARAYRRGKNKGRADATKENAKLKAIAEFQTSSNMDRYFQLKRSKERLTKAKEIIEELLKALDGRSGFDEDVFGRAEQFLKEV